MQPLGSPGHIEPFFVIGFPRSGTTTYRDLINIFTGACVPPESSFITHLEGEHGNWVRGDIDSNKQREFVNDLVAARKFENWQIDRKEIERNIRLFEPSTYSELVAIPYRLYALKMGKNPDYWGDKNNVHGLLIDQLLGIFPEANFIQLARNPLQVYASLKRLRAANLNHTLAPTIPSTVEDFCNAWDDYYEKVNSALLGRKKVLRLTFAQILDNNSEVLKSTAAFLGVPYIDEKTHSSIEPKLWETPEHSYAWKSRSPLELERVIANEHATILSKTEILVIVERLEKRAEMLGIKLIP